MENTEPLTPSIFGSYFVCHREAWFLYNGITPYNKHPLMEEGRVIHEIHHLKRKHGTVSIDNIITIDTLLNGLIVEIKKSSKYLLLPSTHKLERISMGIEKGNTDIYL